MNPIPFFRPCLGEAEIDEVLDTLRSGWLTTGPKVKRFEQDFATAVGASHAVAVNSCTAALHLAVEALGLTRGDAVLVPTMTFSATAAVVRYMGAVPILVDCDPVTTNMDLDDAVRKLFWLRSGKLPSALNSELNVAGMIGVHVGGAMMNVNAIKNFAQSNGLWVVEDGAHAFPAAWRERPADPWERCGENTARVTCFSFYANKTITTGEGGMAVTEDGNLAERMRSMSLHGLSHNAWGRYSNSGSWDYKIVAPGYKYNLTDIAAALGLAQLKKCDRFWKTRERYATLYSEGLRDLPEIVCPRAAGDVQHAWHLYVIQLELDRLRIGRNEFIQRLQQAGIGCSVHFIPLHLHPYYRDTFGYQPDDFPVASRIFQRVLSLPLYSKMAETDVMRVIETVRNLVKENRR
jgi:perosamine synthetase